MTTTITEFFWRMLAKIIARPKVLQALYRRAEKTPYFHLKGYMERWWLFNPITTTEVWVHDERQITKTAKYPRCPVSIRMHHILRADHARDKHNHPGSFRTLIGLGWYVEHRDGVPYPILRKTGDTSVLLNGEFHHVSEVSEGGVWTIFIMWDWRGTWGFRTPSGDVVPRQDYKNGGQP